MKVFNFTLPFGTKSIVVTYDGEIDAGVDLRDITFRVDEENRTIHITMPESKVTNNNIPQEKIVVVTVKNGLFNEITIDDYNTFISEQKVIMQERVIENGLLTQADAEARRIVETTLSLLPGIEEYEVVFG